MVMWLLARLVSMYSEIVYPANSRARDACGAIPDHSVWRLHMAYNRNHARALCTESEFRLFCASLSDEITAHTRAQLRSKIERSRKLRDKYRDLFKRQRLTNRKLTGSKKGHRLDSNARTGDKAKLFSEALARFENRVEKLDAAARRKAPQ